MLMYWTYVVVGSAVAVAMFLTTQAWQLHLAYLAMSFTP